MKMKVGQYYYQRRRDGFQIYRCQSVCKSGHSGDCVSGEFYFDSEEARRRVYELNGWKFSAR